MSTPQMYERKLAEIAEKDARIAELEMALQPFVNAAKFADDQMASLTNRDAMLRRDFYMWRAGQFLRQIDFKNAQAALGKGEGNG